MKHVLALSLLGTAALATDHAVDGSTYNASGTVTFTGYDLSTLDDVVPTRWTIEQRLSHREGDESVWLNMMLWDDVNQIQHAAEGWHLTQAIVTLGTRTSTAPVAGDCRSALSQDCIDGIKAMRCIDPSSGFCDAFSRIEACNLPDISYAHGTPWQNLRKTKDGAWHSVGMGSVPRNRSEKVIREYDTWITSTFLSAIIWHRDGVPEHQQFDSTPLCTTITYVKPGSRGLQEAIESLREPRRSWIGPSLWAFAGVFIMLGTYQWWRQRRASQLDDSDDDSDEPLLG